MTHDDAVKLAQDVGRENDARASADVIPGRKYAVNTTVNLAVALMTTDQELQRMRKLMVYAYDAFEPIVQCGGYWGPKGPLPDDDTRGWAAEHAMHQIAVEKDRIKGCSTPPAFDPRTEAHMQAEIKNLKDEVKQQLERIDDLEHDAIEAGERD